MRKTVEMTVDEEVAVLKAALVDKRAVDVKAYDVRGISGLTDVFVVATGTAAPHIKALVGTAEKTLAECGLASFRVSGDPDSGWMVVDLIDIVVHVFSPEARAYYALEKLWANAKAI